MSSERQTAPMVEPGVRKFDIENFRDLAIDGHVFDQVLVITDPRDAYVSLTKTCSASSTISTTYWLQVILEDIITFASHQSDPATLARLRKKYKAPIHVKYGRIYMRTVPHVANAIISAPIAPTIHILENHP